MNRTAIAAVALTVGIVVGACLSLLLRTDSSSAVPAASRASAFAPRCPAPTRTADGNFRPLFCRIVNPRAVRFYRRLFPRLFALGPNASAGQVEAAFRGARATTPQICSAYRLWSYRWHWKFATDPTTTATGGQGCSAS